MNISNFLADVIKTFNTKLFLCAIVTFYCCVSINGETIRMGQYQVTYLDIPGKKEHCCSQTQKPVPLIHIFCYRGTKQDFVNMWQTVSMELSLSVDEYQRYDGGDPQEVILEYEADRSFWSLHMFTWKEKNIQLNPFNSSCVGIVTNSRNFDIFLNVIRIDFWRPLFLVSGMCFYVMAPQLSGNPLFFYICGVSFGVCTSVLILVYLISKILPSKPMMFTFLVGGSTVGIYLIQKLWDNLRVIAFHYQTQVTTYIAVTGLISFIICYRMGPVTDQRSKNIISWTIQVFSLLLMYSSSQYHEAALLIIFIFLGYHHFPSSLRATAVSFWKKRFPPRVRNLTNEEYYLQGIQSTNEGMEELRRYCSSPECDAWRTMRKLKDPKRFAKFVAGASHIDDDEVLNYEVSDTQVDDITDDETD